MLKYPIIDEDLPKTCYFDIQYASANYKKGINIHKLLCSLSERANISFLIGFVISQACCKKLHARTTLSRLPVSRKSPARAE